MKSLSRSALSVVIAASCGATGACERQPAPAPAPPVKHISAYVVESPAGIQRPPFEFSAADAEFLDKVQRGAFNYFWDQAHPKTALIPDRSSATVVSIAGVGFQLASLCIGVERGWITREQGGERAARIMRTLAGREDIRVHGMFYHFIEGATGGQPGSTPAPPERIVSTIDSAIFLCGAMVAGQYFGGEVASIADRFVDEADWTRFVLTGEGDPHSQGYISLGWKPDDGAAPTGAGKLLPYAWIDSGDEHRLVTFLAAASPREAHRVPPERYYRLRRQLGQYDDTGPLCWFPWSGALFVSMFAHCWIDYAGMGPDDPSAFGVANRPRIDWWENARRTVRLHQIKCAENPMNLPTLSDKAWGLTASDKEGGYLVAGVFPDPIVVGGAIPGLDYPVFEPTDAWGDGTIACYGAGSSIMFAPGPSIAAMRYYAGLQDQRGEPLVWRDPARGGHGFRDAFNLGTGWAAPDDLAIDQGPLLVAIENARTGLIWRLFGGHATARAGFERLGMRPRGWAKP